MNSSDHPKPARRFRSATIYDGLIRSTTRSFLYGLGQDDDEIARPHLGVTHTGGEMSPCNTSLAGQAQHAKTGIYAAGGTARMSGRFGLRRPQHRPQRHAFFADLARADCGQRRGDRPRPPVRRDFCSRRLR